MSTFEIEPVREYPDGRKYYFGSYDNPFNFFELGNGPRISRETEALIRAGGKPNLRAVGEPPADWRAHVEQQNVQARLEQLNRLLGKLPLGSSDQQPLSEHRPAA